MSLLQSGIHGLNTATGSRFVRYVLALLAAILFAVVYNLICYKNFSTQGAMDAAQLGRNLAQGRGYTTQFIRPISLFLLKRTNQEKSGAGTNQLVGTAQTLEAFPDISNPPGYPVALAGLMNVLPFHFTVDLKHPFWSVAEPSAPGGRIFWRYEPDFLIALFNELLLLAVVVAAFLWARRMFDGAVAWMSAIVLLGTELLWRFSVSGLSTLLLMLIFLGLVWCLTVFESETREPKRGQAGLFALSAAAGLLVGLGGLTRYSFAWLIIPMLVWMVLCLRSRGVPFYLTALTAFALVMAPWIVRNYNLSGTPFGTATYAALDATEVFPGHHLERSLNPALRIDTRLLWSKLFANSRDILGKNLFDLGGGWITALFLAGLLVGFRSPALRRMRHFLLLSFLMLIVAQSLGRTSLADDSPQINSENLLVLLLPLVVIYGVSMFYTLLDQVKFPGPELRVYVIGLFGFLALLPMLFALLTTRSMPVTYPPYDPTIIQQSASLMKQNELMMSDIPWAVAWYGNKPCVWLTLNAVPDATHSTDQENILSLSHDFKPVNALYLTPLTIDSRLLSECVRTRSDSWGRFVLHCLALKEVPDNFPLHEVPAGFLPEQLFLSDSKRWQENSAVPNPPSP